MRLDAINLRVQKQRNRSLSAVNVVDDDAGVVVEVGLDAVAAT